jgi:hypothetical protein
METLPRASSLLKCVRLCARSQVWTTVIKVINLHPSSCEMLILLAHTLKVAYWRIMTTELMRSTYVQTPFSTSDSRNVAILSLAQALGNVLQPFVNSGMDDQERGRNLEEILKRSALFAFTMFSQPSTWDFDWKETQSIKAGELCIFPALVQVTDEAGERVKSPRSFSEAVIRRLEG